MPRRTSVRSLPEQAFALRASFPAASAELSTQRLIWCGTITPTTLSRDYTVTITYGLRTYPKVRVVMPVLSCRPGDSIPHLFSDGSLCLHLDDEWTSDMLLVHTIVPWTSEWLFHYEIWLGTGTWNGGGEWPPPRQANSTPTANMTRSERRRAKRRPKR